MIKLTRQHKIALVHAIFYLKPLLKKTVDVQVQRDIESDLRCLHELKCYVEDLLCKPMLPYGSEDFDITV